MEIIKMHCISVQKGQWRNSINHKSEDKATNQKIILRLWLQVLKKTEI